MIRNFVLVILATFVFFSKGYCEESSKEEDFHFRKTRFCMTMAEVKKSEKEKPVNQNEETLAYKDTVMGIKTSVLYMFVNKQLFSCSYLLKEQYRNENNYIVDYLKLKKALIKKYGEPVYDDKTWKNPLYKDDLHKHGFAVSIGHLVYRAEWIKLMKGGRKVRILIGLSGENYKINSGILYIDVLLEKFYKEQEKKKEESKL